MTTKSRGQTGAYDIDELYSLMKHIAKDPPPTVNPVGKSTTVEDEIKEYDAEFDRKADSLYKHFTTNTLVGIMLLFVFKSVHYLFKIAFNFGYWLISFISNRRVVRFTFGMIFGSISNLLLILIIYGFYMLYNFAVTWYSSGTEAATIKSKDDLDALINVVQKTAQILKYIGSRDSRLTNVTESLNDELKTVTEALT